MTNQEAQFELTIDQRSIPNGQAGLVQVTNVRLTPEGYYTNDRGWEPLKVWEDDHLYSEVDLEPIRFLGIYSRNQGSQVYYLYEADGFLRYEWGNGTTANARHQLDFDRHIPEPSEPGTQLIPIADFALICNGYNRPFKFFGHEKVSQFGWTTPPTAPTVYKVEPLYYNALTPLILNTGLGVSTAAILDESDGSDPDFPNTMIGGASQGITEGDEIGNINYAYKVSFVSDSGSESPLSEAGTLDFVVGGTQERRYIAFLQIPIGPDNTIRRRIYRTQQRSRLEVDSGIISSEYFFLKQINDNTTVDVSDATPDRELTILAPSQLDSLPIPNFNFAAVWDGRTWIGGGPYLQNTVVYSNPGQPESFGLTASTFNVSGTGYITALVTFNQHLLIFTETAIDVIVKEGNAYRSVRVRSELGTTATNSIRVVQGLGLVFLASDGFYAIALNQGATVSSTPEFQIRKISESIDPFLAELNTSALGRATACWNPIEKEYWCHLPVRGFSENTVGCVLHSNGQWTFRGPAPDEEQRSMRFTQLACDGTYTVIGAIPFDSADEADPEDGTWNNVGLQVWTAADQWSETLTNGTLEEEVFYEFEKEPGEKGTSIIESNWITITGEQDYKQIIGLEMLALGTTNAEIPLSYATDNLPVFTTAETKPQVAPHSINSSKADATYATSTKESQGVWGTSILNEYRPIRLVWSFPAVQCLSFKFKIQTSELFGIHSYIIKYAQRETSQVNPASKRN